VTIILLILAIAVFAFSVWTVVHPESAIKFRRRSGIPENILTGGIFYSTPRAARITASIVMVATLFGIVELVLRLL
jgi:hypothetical protein